jgi:hypothetical protein
VDFTREPIIETVITPKEGCKLVVRSSKSAGQEEYFVDALEVVTFGHALFFRSLERPKAFLVPASDYEVLEVREARMVLKNVGIERTIKIGGGKAQKEPAYEKTELIPPPEIAAPVLETAETAETKAEGRVDKRRDRRRHARRRRGREEGAPEESEGAALGADKEAGAPPAEVEEALAPAEGERSAAPASFISPLLPPPATLISETIARYRDNALFRDAFYSKEEERQAREQERDEPSEGVPVVEEPSTHPPDLMEEALDMRNISLEPSEFGTFGAMEEEGDFMIREEETPLPPAESTESSNETR